MINRKLTSVILAICLLSVSLGFKACDQQKVARASLKASQDIQLFINSFTQVVLDGEKKALISHQAAASFKQPLTEFINYNERLNEISHELSKTGANAQGKELVIAILNNMLINLSTIEALGILHVKNPDSLRAIHVLVASAIATIQSLQVVVLKG